MPLLRSKSKKVIKENFKDFGEGKTYAKTKAKFGKAKANKQRIAVVLSQSRKSK